MGAEYRVVEMVVELVGPEAVEAVEAMGKNHDWLGIYSSRQLHQLIVVFMSPVSSASSVSHSPVPSISCFPLPVSSPSSSSSPGGL